MDVGLDGVRAAVERMCDIAIENEVYFCELDSVAGDGDFGMSLAKGFRAIQGQLDSICDGGISGFLRGCAMAMLEHCGGATGPLWGAAFQKAALSAKGKDTLGLGGIADMFGAAAEAVQARGGAKPGDKTLLDALVPAADALRDAANEGLSVKEAFGRAADAAQAGAESTKGMVASRGRAAYVGERSIGAPDAGAMAIVAILRGCLDG